MNNKASEGLGKLWAVFKANNPEDWPSIELQEQYWKDRDANLDKTESCTAWFDEQYKQQWNQFLDSTERKLPF